MLPVDMNLMEVGKIKIGKKGAERTTKTGANFRLPEKIDHFIITSNSRNDNGDLIIDQSIMKTLGPEPKEIPIYFLFNSIEENWKTWNGFYSGDGKCFCISQDAQTASRANVEETDINGKMIRRVMDTRNTIKCPGKDCEFQKKNEKNVQWCKPHGKLMVILPMAEQVGGVYVFRTTSWNTIANITSQLVYFQQITHNHIAGLPFIMRIFPKSVKYSDAGVMKSANIFEVGIFYKGNIKTLLSDAEKYTRAILSGENKLLELQSSIKPVQGIDEDTEIIQEFNPDIVGENFLESDNQEPEKIVEKDNPQPNKPEPDQGELL